MASFLNPDRLMLLRPTIPSPASSFSMAMALLPSLTCNFERVSMSLPAPQKNKPVPRTQTAGCIGDSSVPPTSSQTGFRTTHKWRYPAWAPIPCGRPGMPLSWSVPLIRSVSAKPNVYGRNSRIHEYSKIHQKQGIQTDPFIFWISSPPKKEKKNMGVLKLLTS